MSIPAFSDIAKSSNDVSVLVLVDAVVAWCPVDDKVDQLSLFSASIVPLGMLLIFCSFYPRIFIIWVLLASVLFSRLTLFSKLHGNAALLKSSRNFLFPQNLQEFCWLRYFGIAIELKNTTPNNVAFKVTGKSTHEGSTSGLVRNFSRGGNDSNMRAEADQ
jgi:hypothetical protein